VIGLRFDTVVHADDVRELAYHWRIAPRWLPRARVELPLCAADLAHMLSRIVQRTQSIASTPSRVEAARN
jgi:hypothetical protein